MKRFLSTLIFLCVLSNCSQNGNLSPRDSASIKTEVEQMLSAMADSILAQGLAGWLPFMHQSPEFYWEFHGIKNSYDSLVAGEKRESPRYQSIALAWDDIQVQPIALDKATLFAGYVEVVVDTSGRHTTLTGFVEANVIKVSGLWKIRNGRTFDENKGRDHDKN